jgi:hypothetical protein
MSVVLVLANGERRALSTPDGTDDEQALVQIQDRHGRYQNGWARAAAPTGATLVNLDYVVEAIIEGDMPRAFAGIPLDDARA